MNIFYRFIGNNMFKSALVCASFIASMMAGSVNAQQPPAVSLGITHATQQQMLVPGTNYKFVLGSFTFSSEGSVSTDVLLTAIGTWLSDNFDLPAVYDLPRIEPMSSAAMTNLLYGSFLRDRPAEVIVPDNQGQSNQLRHVVSLYWSALRKVVLPDVWL